MPCQTSAQHLHLQRSFMGGGASLRRPHSRVRLAIRPQVAFGQPTKQKVSTRRGGRCIIFSGERRDKCSCAVAQNGTEKMRKSRHGQGSLKGWLHSPKNFQR